MNADWEVGYGTYTSSGTTLSRTAVFASSNAGALVNFGAGTKYVICTMPATVGDAGRDFNAIINPDMYLNQRTLPITAAATGAYFVDRFLYYKIGAMVHDLNSSTDVPTVAQAGRLIPASALVDCTTVDASIAAGDYCFIAQWVEGYNFLPLAQRVMTLSFWVKATKTGIYCVAFRNSGSDRSYVAEYTINTTATWEFKTITVPASPSAGTWNYTNGAGIGVQWTLACGSTFQTTANAWQTGNFIATANQVNACDSTSNDFRLTSVKLEPGSAATPMYPRSLSAEFDLCLRYYNGAMYGLVGGGATPTVTGRQFYCTMPFPVPMRITPTATKSGEVLSNMNAGTVGDLNGRRMSYYATNSVANDCIAYTTIILNAEL
jgi:hypothetical protein